MDNEKKCKYDGCSRNLYDDEHCLFHSKDIEGKKEQFTKEFHKEFERQSANEKTYNFRGFVFSDSISFKGFLFNKDVNFSSAYFSRLTGFVNVTFSGSLSFESVTFAGGTDFGDAKFLGLADFTNVVFEDKVLFPAAIFSGGVNFRDATFSKETYFGASQFSSTAYFGGATFSETVFFGAANFSVIANFDETIFRDIVEVNMVDTYFYNVRGLLEILNTNESKKKRRNSITGTEFLSERIKIILGEMASNKYPIIDRQIKDDRLLMKYKEKHPGWFKIWWLLADCGRSLRRWTIWSIGIALLFAFLFIPAPDFFPDWWIKICNDIGPRFEQTAEAYHGESLNLWSALYFSIVTFTTLGFGDVVTANTTARVLVVLEVILGYVMLGGLISILANKLARRS